MTTDSALKAPYVLEGVQPLRGSQVWLDADWHWHKMTMDYRTKRRYLDGKRVPWNEGNK